MYSTLAPPLGAHKTSPSTGEAFLRQIHAHSVAIVTFAGKDKSLYLPSPLAPRTVRPPYAAIRTSPETTDYSSTTRTPFSVAANSTVALLTGYQHGRVLSFGRGVGRVLGVECSQYRRVVHCPSFPSIDIWNKPRFSVANAISLNS